DANTFTNDTSPCRSAVDRPRSRPLTGARLNSGTGLPINGEGTLLGSRLRLTPKASMSPAKATAGTRNSKRNRSGLAASGGRSPSAPAAPGVFVTAMSLDDRIDFRRTFGDLVD